MREHEHLGRGSSVFLGHCFTADSLSKPLIFKETEQPSDLRFQLSAARASSGLPIGRAVAALAVSGPAGLPRAAAHFG